MTYRRWLSYIVLLVLFFGVPVCFGDLPRHVDPSLSVSVDPYPAEFAELYSQLFSAIEEEDYGTALEVLGLGADMEALAETKLIIDRYNELIVETVSSLNMSDVYLSEAADYLIYVQTDMVDDVLLRGISEMSDANVTLGLLFETAIQLGNKLDIPQEELFDDLRKAGEILEKYYSTGLEIGEESLFKEMLISDKLLNKTFLSIDLEESSVLVGDLILVQGYLGQVNGSGLSREVLFYLDGAYIGRAVTDADGAFYVGFPAPAVYGNGSIVWAEYWPSGVDSSVLTPTRSNFVDVFVGYRVPSLEVVVPDSVLPGKRLLVEGVYVYAGEPIGGLDLVLVAGGDVYNVSTDARGLFVVTVDVPDNARGNFTFTLLSKPRGVTGPSSNSFVVPVALESLTVIVSEPRFTLSGGYLVVKGKVISRDNASYLVTFQGEPGRYSTTSFDGLFEIRVPLSLSLASAWYPYLVTVESNLPWLLDSSVSGSFLVVSPLIPAVLMFVAAYLVLNKDQVAALLNPVEESEVLHPVIESGRSVDGGSVFDVIRGLFGVELGETMTLREYLTGVRRVVGERVYEAVQGFVHLYEKWVYGGSLVKEQQIESAGEEALRRIEDED